MRHDRRDRARWSASVTAVAAVLALTVTACGGSSSAPASSSSSSASSTAASAGASGSSTSESVGHRIFVSSGCGGCHTLAAAHSSGTEGPDLDQLKPSYAEVVSQVKNGGGAMPSFSGRLSTTQIAAVARFVASATK